MAESPSKRQRLSDDTYQTTGTQQDDITTTNNPTTPTRRASYLSPTKASLARSHPDILAKSPIRGSTTEPRGRLLRQELLGSRRKPVASPPKTAPRPPSINTQDDPFKFQTKEHTGGDEFAKALSATFPSTNREENAQREPIVSSLRSPLRSRQPSNTSARKRTYNEKRISETLGDLPVPKLVSRSDLPARQPSESRNEPELPPTPIQLGIRIAPERPKGLASSSSFGSKSGSGRHRQRVRGGDRSAITSSPLKRRNNRPISPTDFSDIEEIEKEIADEAPESDVEELEGQKEDEPRGDAQEVGEVDVGVDQDVLERQTELSNLQDELEKLRGDLALMESLADRLHQEAELDIDGATLELLKPDTVNGEVNHQSPSSHPSFTQNPSAYLNLFSPGNLQLSHETTTQRIQTLPKIIHKLSLKPPAPWPVDVMQLSFNTQIDPEECRVEQIVEIRTGNFRENSSLHQWIERRFESHLHKHDIGGLIWGIGRYFEACVTRAKALKAIDEKYNHDSMKISSKTNGASVDETHSLVRYFHKTQLEIPCRSSTSQMSHVSNDSITKSVLMTYEIDLTWTGDTVANVDIALQGINNNAQKGAKELFKKLLETEDLVRAFDGVWNVLGYGNDDRIKPVKKGVSKARRGIGVA